MLFQSYEYVFIFLPAVLIVYIFIKTSTLHNLFLLLASYLFYCYGNFHLIYYILFSSCLDYYLGQKIYREASKKRRCIFLIISLTGNLSILAVIKYANCLFKLIVSILQWLFPEIEIIYEILEFNIPPGFSFYTF